MNLYIINEVLYDYTEGMCVIAAESMPGCEQLFMKEFASDKSDYGKERMQKEFNEAAIKVIDNIPHDKGEVVSYVYGGG
jgi:hypothetical protein